MNNFRAELSQIIQKSLETNFGKATMIENNCDVSNEKEICLEYIFRTEPSNTDREFYEVTIRMVTEQLKDGSTYWYNSVNFAKNKW
jgi:hypothetical protein